MSKFWSSMVKRTEPYVPGLQVNDPQVVKLNTNENPYPPSPNVEEAIEEALENLRLYPSPTVDRLREEIGKRYSLKKEEVFIGNGSDEVLAFSFMAFFEPGKAIHYPEITYSFYPVYAKLFHIPVEEVPLNGDFSLPVEKFYHSEGGIIFPNPNAPTSLYLSLEEVKKILDHNKDVVVIVDEAYVDFAEQSAASLIPNYDNLLVIQTTSKSRSLAGLRVGFALGQKHLIDALIRIKDSFNSYTIDQLAIAGATAAFQDEEYFQSITEKIIQTRKWTTEEMENLGFHVLPSQTNFVFATHPEVSAADLYQQLEKRKFLVRYFNQPKIDNYLRITIGTDEEMKKLLACLKELIADSMES